VRLQAFLQSTLGCWLLIEAAGRLALGPRGLPFGLCLAALSPLPNSVPVGWVLGFLALALGAGMLWHVWHYLRKDPRSRLEVAVLFTGAVLCALVVERLLYGVCVVILGSRVAPG
jgi:hypothetical protein